MAIAFTQGRWRQWLVLAAASSVMSLTGGCGSSNNNAATGGADGGATGGRGGMTATGGRGGATDSGAADAVDAADAPTDRAPDGNIDAPTDAPPAAMLAFPFDTGLDGFDIDRIATTNPFNLGALSADGGVVVATAFDSTVGMPAAGSAHITATFSDYNQLVAFRRVYANTQTINLTGKTITAQIRLDPGVDGGTTVFSGVARLYVLSTPTNPGFYLAEGGSVTLSDNAWHTMIFHIATPEFVSPNFNPADIVQVGVHLATPPPITGDGGGPAFGAPQSISVHFDTMTSN